MRYLSFVTDNGRLLSYGLVLACFSGFGHPYFIGLFNADIRATFGLSHGEFGFIYSLATLGNGVAVLWIAGKQDDTDLRLYSALVCAAQVAACFMLAVAPSVVMLFVALLALRAASTGAWSASGTTMARYFGRQRGTAAAVASLGRPLGEAILPSVVVAVAVVLDWREMWTGLGLALGVTYLVGLPVMLRGHGERHRRLLAAGLDGAQRTGTPKRQWSRREVLRDPRFYRVLPVMLGPPFVFTGFFFHQAHLADVKGWGLAWLATCFVGYAVVKVLSGLLSGPFIDRVGAMRMLPYYVMPMALGVASLVFFDHPAVGMAYMIAMGVSVGIRQIIMSAMWAELYGLAHLGAIRGLATALNVGVAALAPVAMGWLIDVGVTMEAIAAACALYLFVSSVLIGFDLRRNR